jgi:hypothetical protein
MVVSGSDEVEDEVVVSLVASVVLVARIVVELVEVDNVDVDCMLLDLAWMTCCPMMMICSPYCLTLLFCHCLCHPPQ